MGTDPGGLGEIPESRFEHGTEYQPSETVDRSEVSEKPKPAFLNKSNRENSKHRSEGSGSARSGGRDGGTPRGGADSGRRGKHPRPGGPPPMGYPYMMTAPVPGGAA